RDLPGRSRTGSRSRSEAKSRCALAEATARCTRVETGTDFSLSRQDLIVLYRAEPGQTSVCPGKTCWLRRPSGSAATTSLRGQTEVCPRLSGCPTESAPSRSAAAESSGASVRLDRLPDQLDGELDLVAAHDDPVRVAAALPDALVVEGARDQLAREPDLDEV